jgi:dolichyl-phosphate-mannose--protein O-mannosyl transferase
MLLLGLYLRVHAFEFPPTFLFDEHHFVENARNYINHRADENDHPPLGKLIIAGFIQVLGDRPAGWRAGGLLAGILTVLLGATAARRLFDSGVAGWLAAGLLSADGFLISYSRAALLDGFLAACAVATLAVCTLRATWLTTLLAGLVAGLAVSVKFSGLGVLPPLLLTLALAPRSMRAKAGMCSLLLATTIAIYVGCYSWGLLTAGQPASVVDVVRDTARLVVHHASLTDMKNPWTSGWVTWVLPSRPILLGYVGQTGTVRALTSLGNLAIWWPSVGLGAYAACVVLWRGVGRTLSVDPEAPPSAIDPRAFVAAHGRSVVTLLATTIGFLAPWVLTHRDSYVYHFLPSYASLVVLLGGYVSWVYARRRRIALGYMAAVLMLAGFYAPVWSTMPMTAAAFNLRLFLGSWR